ncbi:hypothetical protein ACIF8W_03870 [Streptomyces sp. NPDC085639]|uniref:hypothetical protein n=1 Tax=Streptomyces sp. NPDC085639 TaxID=3365734 RepID=UPI0037D1DFE9
MPTPSTANSRPGTGPRIREIFRTVVTDGFEGRPAPAHAELLFADAAFASDREFLGDFSNEILHQDTCNELTHEGVPLLAVLATDDRVPPLERMSLVSSLFSIATVSERHAAACRPQAHPRANPAGEERARASVDAVLPQLLARWETECVTVRIALAAMAVAFHVAQLPSTVDRPRTAHDTLPRRLGLLASRRLPITAQQLFDGAGGIGVHDETQIDSPLVLPDKCRQQAIADHAGASDGDLLTARQGVVDVRGACLVGAV